jgi:hypothetical protein
MVVYTLSDIRKTNLKDTFFGTYIYRKLSTYVTYFFVKTTITPNQVSILSLFSSLVAAYLFSFGRFSYTVPAIIFLQLGMILDYSDGQIARLKKLSSKFGAWMDVIFGMIQNNLVILGMTSGYFRNTGNPDIWLLGFITLFAWNMTCFVHLNAMIFFPGMELKATILAKQVQKGFHLPPQFFSIGSDVYFVILSLAVILHLLPHGFLLMVILGNLYWLAVSLYYFKLYK